MLPCMCLLHCFARWRTGLPLSRVNFASISLWRGEVCQDLLGVGPEASIRLFSRACLRARLVLKLVACPLLSVACGDTLRIRPLGKIGSSASPRYGDACSAFITGLAITEELLPARQLILAHIVHCMQQGLTKKLMTFGEKAQALILEPPGIYSCNETAQAVLVHIALILRSIDVVRLPRVTDATPPRSRRAAIRTSERPVAHHAAKAHERDITP
mmetsp:Transcript_38258/g.83334  ORF Transcript_38258/g.83334 Transcript_38258/m.83334 type:complete len:215 (-) Transcript_38258:14-658(-)